MQYDEAGDVLVSLSAPKQLHQTLPGCNSSGCFQKVTEEYTIGVFMSVEWVQTLTTDDDDFATSDIGKFNNINMGFHECRISTNVTIKLKDKERVAILETGNSTLNLIFWKTRVCCVRICNWMRSVERKVQTTPLGFSQTNKTNKINNKKKSWNLTYIILQYITAVLLQWNVNIRQMTRISQ